MAGRVVSDPNAPAPVASPGYQQPYDQSVPSSYAPPGINMPRPMDVSRRRYTDGQILVNPTPGVTPTVIQGGVGPNADLPTGYAPPQQGALPPLDPNQQSFEQMDLHDWLAAQAANPTVSPLAQNWATTQSMMSQYQPGGQPYDPTLAPAAAAKNQTADGYSFVADPGTRPLPDNILNQTYPNGIPPVPPPPTGGYPQTYPGWGEPGGPTPPPGWINYGDWQGQLPTPGFRNQGFPPQFDPYVPYPPGFPQGYSWPNIPPGIGGNQAGQLTNPYADWLRQQAISNSGFDFNNQAPGPYNFPSWWYPYQLPPWGGTGDPPAPPPDPNGLYDPNAYPTPV